MTSFCFDLFLYFRFRGEVDYFQVVSVCICLSYSIWVTEYIVRYVRNVGGVLGDVKGYYADIFQTVLCVVSGTSKPMLWVTAALFLFNLN